MDCVAFYKDELQDDHDDCSICYEPISAGDAIASHIGKFHHRRLTRDGCQKNWHEYCFLAWIMSGRYGTCPNCRGKILEEGDWDWEMTADRINDILMAGRGTWKYGRTGYQRSRLTLPQGSPPLGPPKINRRVSRLLHSPDCPIPFLPLSCERHIIPRYIHQASIPVRMRLFPAVKSWLEARHRLAFADTLNPPRLQTADTGWRLLTWKYNLHDIHALVRVKRERMDDEENAWQAFRKWDRMSYSAKIRGRETAACPLWSLKDYDEAYIVDLWAPTELWRMVQADKQFDDELQKARYEARERAKRELADFEREDLRGALWCVFGEEMDGVSGGRVRDEAPEAEPDCFFSFPDHAVRRPGRRRSSGASVLAGW